MMSYNDRNDSISREEWQKNLEAFQFKQVNIKKVKNDDSTNNFHRTKVY